MHFNLTRSILAFGSEKSCWMSRHSHEVFFVTCLPARKFLFQKGNASLRFSLAYFFLPRPFSRFTLARHRKLSRLVKGRRLVRRRPAKGIFRACLLLLHPLRRHPQKLKCKAIERWSTLIPPAPLSHLFEEFRAESGGSRRN